MENGKSNDTSNERKTYRVKMFQEYLIEPTKKILEKLAGSDHDDYLQQAYLYLKSTKEHLDILEDGMTKKLYRNDPKELEELREQYKDNIDKLTEPLDNYRQTVQEEEGKIDIESLKTNYLSPDKHELPFDKIVLTYDEPLYDRYYGKVIRETLMILQKHLGENNNSQMNDFKDFVTKLEERVQSIDLDLESFMPSPSDIEKLNKAKGSLKILIQILKKNIESKEI